MQIIRKILSLLFICTLVTAILLVSGCTETLDDSEDINGEAVESENISLDDIADIEWQWSELVEDETDRQSAIPNPESYTISFEKDGTYYIKADCNQGSGSYTLKENALTLVPGPITLAYCGQDSLDDQYLSLLSNVTTVSIDNKQLILGIGDSGESMLFVKEEGAADNNEESEPLSIVNGTISSFDDGESHLTFLLESEEISSSGYAKGIKFVISDETVIVNPNGGLFDAENLKEGMELRVFFEPTLTKSIPPIGQAELIRLI
ncbi:META domain-containing protein [Methanolobus bombayensis]|uniref:META domain-containing protein n=1 Tax=Methanolobus bombayensis TaxID=38023 RepID=UPI001AE6F5FB|nr:META domain-containing protein [Methanolobus bombayensis]MBP1908502.1 heat shock protein HslJ [Methanolobus bombayensis]